MSQWLCRRKRFGLENQPPYILANRDYNFMTSEDLFLEPVKNFFANSYLFQLVAICELLSDLLGTNLTRIQPNNIFA